MLDWWCEQAFRRSRGGEGVFIRQMTEGESGTGQLAGGMGMDLWEDDDKQDAADGEQDSSKHPPVVHDPDHRLTSLLSGPHHLPTTLYNVTKRWRN